MLKSFHPIDPNTSDECTQRYTAKFLPDTLLNDPSRIKAHIVPLLDSKLVAALRPADAENFPWTSWTAKLPGAKGADRRVALSERIPQLVGALRKEGHVALAAKIEKQSCLLLD